jgi:hypothetical protein
MKITPSKTTFALEEDESTKKDKEINYIREALLKFSRKKCRNYRELLYSFNNKTIFQEIVAAINENPCSMSILA